MGACGCGRYTTSVGDMGWVLDVGDIGWVLDVGDMQWVLVQVAGGRYATTVGDMGWVLLVWDTEPCVSVASHSMQLCLAVLWQQAIHAEQDRFSFIRLVVLLQQFLSQRRQRSFQANKMV